MKKVFYTLPVILLAAQCSLEAQSLQPDTLLMSAALHAELTEEEEDASDFTFTESQLDEDMDAAQTIAIATSAVNDPFLSNVGFAWSATRFRLRALDNMYSTTYLNGVEFNDLESGRYNYSLLGGLNDATRQKEGATGFDVNGFGVTGIGGGENMNLRASRFAAGNKLTLTACNRNYRYRGMYTYASGIINNGWAFAGTVGFRYADEGVIEGTFYNSISYLLSAEKRFGDEHSLSLVTFGAPTERGQQGASTEEAYWLAGSHYYNPNWGYQDGKKRNSRVVKDFEPTAILTWEWNPNNETSLVTSAAMKYSSYSSSALGWGGEAYDPRPDYYKNLPSGVFNVYDTDPNGNGNNDKLFGENAFLLEEYNRLYDMWQTKANRQVNWDRMYFVNQQNGEALYYLERRHNDQLMWTFSTTFNRQLDRHQRLHAGFYFNHTQGMHYKTMDDLLGGSRYLDIDKFAAGDYGMNSIQAQPDIRKPLQYVGQDDKFGYNYNTYVNLEKLWAQYNYHAGSLNVDLSAHVSSTHMQREGLMQNGQGMVLLTDAAAMQEAANAGRLVQYNGQSYYDNSLGASGWATFIGGGAKGKLTWAPVLNHRFSVAASWEKKAPIVRNAFVAPRVQNNFVKNLSLEDIMGVEAEYMFHAGIFRGSVTGYYLGFNHAVEQTAFFNDAYSAFTYLTMSKVDRRHYGVEAALDIDLSFLLENLTFRTMASVGNAEYTSNPYAELTTEGMSNADNAKVNTWTNPVTHNTMPLQVIADGMKVSGTPLTAVNLGLKYNKNYWFFEVNANYYDRVYIGFSPYRRLTNIMGNHTPSSVDANGNIVYAVSAQELSEQGGVLFTQEGAIRKSYSPVQEKGKGSWMLDASIGKSLRLRHGKTMSINLQAQNLTNNTNIKTGGYEQNRDDSYYNTYGTGDGSKGQDKAYKFSKNPKYYYANAINFFLNVGYKF